MELETLLILVVIYLVLGVMFSVGAAYWAKKNKNEKVIPVLELAFTGGILVALVWPLLVLIVSIHTLKKKNES
jgi:hypothetical protein